MFEHNKFYRSLPFMKITIIIFSLFIIILGSIYFFYGYKSAFEADQQCHYDMRLESIELDGLDCDHDIETHQWLLFQEGVDDQPSKVLKRYRY